ncbi:MAG: SDR family oxidoreductase [Bacteroidota bacterium]|nr:SDR family oxidoreductase [Bacteroidota bacterium]
MKTALITGTSSGIGLELIKKFDKESIRTISLSRSDIVSDHEFSSNLTHINFDITNVEDIKKLVEFLNFNSLQVDFLINNAGKLVNKPFLDQSEVDFKTTYDVNFFGIVRLIQSLFPFFKKDSHILNVSSIGGIGGSSKFPGLSSYSSSKGALNILTEVLATEFKEGPYFNTLCLGAVQTPMLELAFPGYKAEVKPEDMAQFIYNFCTSNPLLFNGKVIPVSISNP